MMHGRGAASCSGDFGKTNATLPVSFNSSAAREFLAESAAETIERPGKLPGQQFANFRLAQGRGQPRS